MITKSLSTNYDMHPLLRCQMCQILNYTTSSYTEESKHIKNKQNPNSYMLIIYIKGGEKTIKFSTKLTEMALLSYIVILC